LPAQRREMPIASAAWAMGGAGFDAPAQQQSTLRRERSVTVSHGDLRFGVLALSPAHLLPEVSRFVDYRVTNVRVGNAAEATASECVVVGDSEEKDIAPAVAPNGMRSILAAIEQPPPSRTAADAVVTSLDHAGEILRSWVTSSS
jgi:hypothetical protein